MVACWENYVQAIKIIKNAMSTWPHGYDTFFPCSIHLRLKFVNFIIIKIGTDEAIFLLRTRDNANSENPHL